MKSPLGEGQTLEYPPEYYAQFLFFARSDLEWARSGREAETGFYHKPCFEARECVAP